MRIWSNCEINCRHNSLRTVNWTRYQHASEWKVEQTEVEAGAGLAFFFYWLFNNNDHCHDHCRGTNPKLQESLHIRRAGVLKVRCTSKSSSASGLRGTCSFDLQLVALSPWCACMHAKCIHILALKISGQIKKNERHENFLWSTCCHVNNFWLNIIKLSIGIGDIN